jgi:hypothetical protein
MEWGYLARILYTRVVHPGSGRILSQRAYTVCSWSYLPENSTMLAGLMQYVGALIGYCVLQNAIFLVRTWHLVIF